jgi:hypothetical protein
MGPIGYPELILIFLVINMVLYLLFLELEQPSSDITLGKPPPLSSLQAPSGAITSANRNRMWKMFWLCAVGASQANIFVVILLAGIDIIPPLIILGLAAIPPFVVWAVFAKQLEKYKAHTGISYPTTYIVLAILSIIGLIGPLLMLISFSIRLRKIPVIQAQQ